MEREIKELQQIVPQIVVVVSGEKEQTERKREPDTLRK